MVTRPLTLAEIAGLQCQIEELLDTGRTPLRAEPDLDTVSRWSVSAHRRHWGWA